MAVRPILFSAPMVRALIAGTKTQTRRVLKLVPPEDATEVHTWFAPPDVPTCGIPNKWAESGLWAKKPGAHGYVRYVGAMPYRPGDCLWVRESVIRTPAGVAYAADGIEHFGAGGRLKATPSIHMPRIASRLTLVVTDVRVQRLQEISEEDAIAEGIEKVPYVGSRPEYSDRFGWRDYSDHPHAIAPFVSPAHSFESLWTSINGPDAWAANPWVAAYTFTTHRQQVDAFLKAREAA